MKVGALFIVGITTVSADVANPHVSELAEFQEVAPQQLEAPRSCTRVNHCCIQSAADCCTRFGHYTANCESGCRCDHSPSPQVPEPSAPAAPQNLEESKPDVWRNPSPQVPEPNKTAPKCVGVNQCATSCAQCCSTYGHYTRACPDDHVHWGCRCDSGPAAPQQLEASAPAAPQNLEESKPDVTCYSSGACFVGSQHGVCLDRCCSGQCEQHQACGDHESGGWRCKGNVQGQRDSSNASLTGGEPQPLEPATLAGEALQEMDQFNPRPGLATQCLGDGMCCEEYNCNLCCTGKYHKTLACGMQGKRCGKVSAADSENVDEMVV